ncbi:MAG: sialidase family protein [Rhodospirillaceae bacterium]|nr:sialidase family protein [Rhodospirillaceae bacterium]
MLLKKLSLAIFAFCIGVHAAIAETISPPGHVAVAPDLAVNAKGEIALLWVDRAPEDQRAKEGAGTHDNHLSYTDLYVAVSRDGGATFAAPTKVNHDAGVVWGQTVSRPRIVGAASGTWHVAYTANEMNPAIAKPVLTTHYTRSTDGAAGFEAPRRLSTLTESDLSHMIHGGFASAAAFGTIAAAPNGSVHVMWIDTRHMKTETDTGAMYAAASRDDGKTFSPDRELFGSAVCPCCQFMAVADAQSNILVSARYITGDNIRQGSVARIDAKTGAVSAPVGTGGAPWQIAACPLKPTVMALRGETVFAAVYNGGEEKPGVFFSVSTDGAKSFGPAVAAHPEAIVSDAPSIAVNDRFVALAWHGKTTGPRRVFYRMYDLTGRPVGDIAELTTGEDNAQNPVLATRADGKFQIAWQQSSRIHTAVLPATPTKVADARN